MLYQHDLKCLSHKEAIFQGLYLLGLSKRLSFNAYPDFLPKLSFEMLKTEAHYL